MDKVFIKDLSTRAIIGVYDWEREQPQDILINITIETDTRQAGKTDDINECIDYDALSKNVLTHVERIQRFTVEALAEDIAKICLEEFKAERVYIRVEKPRAVKFAKSVGVEIVRSR
jgi:FolB domain-containing protein